tara:strand:- start:453 stop:656 length:204 start_codon:yes stop_codon:yes gene_type:complete
MGKVIEIDFQKHRRDELASLESFEQAMKTQQVKARFRTAGLLALLSMVVIGIAALPFLVQKLFNIAN